MSLSNYPPGVTGNEWEIAGYPPCGRMGCGHEDAEHWLPEGGSDPPAQGECFACEEKGEECEGYTPYSDRDEYEPDLEAGT